MKDLIRQKNTAASTTTTRSLFQNREQKQHRKELEAIERQAHAQAYVLEHKQNLARKKVRAIQRVGQAAIEAQLPLALVEEFVVGTAPQASGRAAHIAERTALALANTVDRFAEEVI